MKKPFALIILTTFLGILVGWGSGSYLGTANLKAELAALPAAPIVIDASYQSENKTLSLTLSNPGGQAISILGKAIAFKPKDGQKGYQMAYVAFKKPLIIPPFSVETLEAQLKGETPILKDGDILATTMRYVYPISGDIYDLTHTFVQGQKTTKAKANK